MKGDDFIGKMTIGRAALWLAMSEDREQESKIQSDLLQQGYHSVATEVSGPLLNVRQNIVKNVVAAAVNTKVIDNTPMQIHSVTHAMVEALSGVVTAPNAPRPSLKIKVGIVSDQDWVCVALYALTSFHPSYNHEKVGIGTMAR